MLNWWNSLGIKGKMYFWAAFGFGVNGLLYLIDLWMPYLLAFAIAMLLVGFLLPKSVDE